MIFISDNDYTRAAENGVYPNLLRTRVYQLKWDLERAITQTPRKRGVSMFQLAKDNGIPINLYYKRVHAGWTPVEAATIRKGESR